jgi:hypothetical protein
MPHIVMHVAAVVLELAMVSLMVCHRDWVSLSLAAAYFIFSATCALLERTEP